MKRSLGQLLRYGAVGLALNAALYFMYLLITWFGVDPKLAATITFLMGTPVAFWSHGRVTFQSQGALDRKAMRRFVLVYVLGYLVNIGGLYLFVDALAWPHAPVQLGLVLLVALGGFIAQKLWVFRE